LKGKYFGPETVLVDPTGEFIVTSTANHILKINIKTKEVKAFPSIGRIIGFDFDKEGDIIGCDCINGLVSISKNGDRMLLTNSVDEDGSPITYADV